MSLSKDIKNTICSTTIYVCHVEVKQPFYDNG